MNSISLQVLFRKVLEYCMVRTFSLLVMIFWKQLSLSTSIENVRGSHCRWGSVFLWHLKVLQEITIMDKSFYLKIQQHQQYQQEDRLLENNPETPYCIFFQTHNGSANIYCLDMRCFLLFNLIPIHLS
jgi:hypothetical protein